VKRLKPEIENFIKVIFFDRTRGDAQQLSRKKISTTAFEVDDGSLNKRQKSIELQAPKIPHPKQSSCCIAIIVFITAVHI